MALSSIPKKRAKWTIEGTSNNVSATFPVDGFVFIQSRVFNIPSLVNGETGLSVVTASDQRLAL